MSETRQQDAFGDDTAGNDVLAVAQNLDGIDTHRWPRMLAELVDVFSAAAEREGIAESKHEASDIGRWVVLTLGLHLGGRQVYIPRGDGLRIALRDIKLYNEWLNTPDNNVDQLAKDYRLSIVQVYKIINEQRALHRNKVQGSLALEHPHEHPRT